MTKLLDKLQTKSRRLTFFAGATILLILLIGFIISWFDVVSENQARWNALSEQSKLEIVRHNLIPSLQANFWKKTLTFTYISNFSIGLALLLYALRPNSIKTNNFLILSGIYISVTFLIFWGLIFPGLFIEKVYSPTRMLVSITTHFVNPIIGISFLLFNSKKLTFSNKLIFWSLAPMFIYYFFAMGMYFIGNSWTKQIHLEASNNEYHLAKIQDLSGLTIYPFLNFEYPLFYKGNSILYVVIFNILILIIGTSLPIALGFAFKYLAKIKFRTRRKYE
ncbi:MAGa3780 family membrane protein [Mycoplasmopsis glycophila]|uniref:Uncharacterized protein n=1 Tax=Mycoplasmopsis glycophila TaxID=171285 RepID=A0A449AUX4_9BACT|nr:hypothetical protein [Mycoplasmopsis glycophila]VEU70319.1 Uncharacterised protein [Mycoplasmopsis glycophila]